MRPAGRRWPWRLHDHRRSARAFETVFLASVVLTITSGCGSPTAPEHDLDGDATVEASYDSATDPEFVDTNPTRFALQPDGRLTAFVRITSSQKVPRIGSIFTVADGTFVSSLIEASEPTDTAAVYKLTTETLPRDVGLVSVYFLHPPSSPLTATPVVAVPLRIGTHFNTSKCQPTNGRARFVLVHVREANPELTHCSLARELPGTRALDTSAGAWQNAIPLKRSLQDESASELSGEVFIDG